MKDNRGFLVDKAQPFGQYTQTRMHPGSPVDHGYTSKSLGYETVKSNHGYNHAPSDADKGAGAKAFACRNNDNPMAWTRK